MEPAADNRRWWGLVAIALAQLMIVVDMTIINVALPSLNHDLGISTADRQWVITAYTLPFAGLLLLGGRIADRTGRKPGLLIGLIGFAAASAVGGASTGTAMLLAARAAQGAFGALMAPASLSLLAATFHDPSERAKAYGAFGGVTAAGSPIGLIVGGILTTTLSWHWVLYVNVPISLLSAAGVLAFLRSSRPGTRAPYDILGATLATACLVALVYGLSEATVSGWRSADTIGPLVSGAALLTLFLFIESRSADPLLPLGILRDRSRSGAYLVVLLMMAAPFGAYLFIGYFLQDVKGYSALLAGVAFLPLTVGVMAGTGIGAKLMTRMQARAVISGGLLLGAAGMALLAGLGVRSSYPSGLLPSFLMIGIGMGVVLPATLELSTVGVPPDQVGVASALFNMAQQTGSSLDTALLNTVAATTAARYTVAHPHAARLGQVHGYDMSSAWAAGILVIASLGAITLIDARLGKPSTAAANASVN